MLAADRLPEPTASVFVPLEPGELIVIAPLTVKVIPEFILIVFAPVLALKVILATVTLTSVFIVVALAAAPMVTVSVFPDAPG
ncbi:MAG TPA: hypothetical protein VHA30_03235 [Patescibacteria group bacterium]|nr:hypothetical protein [Patescibacteria group bacterium]